MKNFENKLQRAPFRSVPPKWRNEILAVAHAAATPQTAASVSRASAPRAGAALPGWLRELLWPCPQAWAGLAAVWAILLVLNFSVVHETKPELAVATQPASAEIRMALRAQNRMRDELMNTMDASPMEEPKRGLLQPRSEIPSTFSIV